MAYVRTGLEDWRFADGVQDATYTDPQGNAVGATKVREGDGTVDGYGGGEWATALSRRRFAVWLDPAAASSEIEVDTVGIDGELVIDGTTYKITTIESYRADRTQVVVTGIAGKTADPPLPPADGIGAMVIGDTFIVS